MNIFSKRKIFLIFFVCTGDDYVVAIGEGFVDRLECFSSHKEGVFEVRTGSDLFKELEVIFAFPGDFVLGGDTLKV